MQFLPSFYKVFFFPDLQFAYKKRDQKFPLRSKGTRGEQEPPEPIKTTHNPPQGDYHTLRRPSNGNEPKKIAEKSTGQKPVGKRTDWQAMGRRGNAHIGNGTVTLTQAQLDAILETVGRLALDKEKLAATAGKIVRQCVGGTTVCRISLTNKQFKNTSLGRDHSSFKCYVKLFFGNLTPPPLVTLIPFTVHVHIVGACTHAPDYAIYKFKKVT